MSANPFLEQATRELDKFAESKGARIDCLHAALHNVVLAIKRNDTVATTSTSVKDCAHADWRLIHTLSPYAGRVEDQRPVRWCVACGAIDNGDGVWVKPQREWPIIGKWDCAKSSPPAHPLAENLRAPMPMADAVKLTLPTFAELQEGDWVQCDAPTHAGTWRREGYVRSYDGSARLLLTSGDIDHAYHVVAFKPLRQVVEELARQHGVSLNVWPQTEGVEVSMGVRQSPKGWSNYGIRINEDERTALLAAKAALEVMLARKVKP